jgi:hypothetical protein
MITSETRRFANRSREKVIANGRGACNKEALTPFNAFYAVEASLQNLQCVVKDMEPQSTTTSSLIKDMQMQIAEMKWKAGEASFFPAVHSA